MRSKIYLILAILSFIGIFVAIGMFSIWMMDGSFLDDDLSMSALMLRIFLYVGALGAMLFLTSFFFIKYAKAQAGRTNPYPVKKCTSCGAELGITELSCPRCFTLQPPEDRNVFRRK
jgi:formate hydrogenlyase subunit 3/multisubunit Na+/H+ antiporter MnhD subunit